MEKLVKLNFRVNEQLAHSNLTALCIILCAKLFLLFVLQAKMSKTGV